MKKLILILAIFLFSLPAFADFYPSYLSSIHYTGIGVYLVGKETVLYSEKDLNSKIIDKFTLDHMRLKGSSLKLTYNDTFIAGVPSKGIAILAVEDEDEDWVKVYYSQSNGYSGWVKKSETKRFYTWREFFYYFGKKYGLYTFKDLPKDAMRLYAKPQEDAQAVDSFSYARYISPVIIRGNWMLIKAIDFNNEQKVGYIRFRTNEGRLLLFPFLN